MSITLLNYQTILHCDKCDDAGFILKADNKGFMQAVVCECDTRRKVMIALKKSGLADSIEKFRFDNFNQHHDFQKLMYETCQGFIAQDNEKFLFIGGQSGSGKTHLGTAVCAHFINKGVNTIYTTFEILMNNLKSKLNDEDYEDEIYKYGNVPVLYIDDFMKFEPSKSDIKNTFEVINMRAVNGKTTIITSERSIDEILQIDEALGGRIKQRCGEYAIYISKKDGRNYRLGKEKL